MKKFLAILLLGCSAAAYAQPTAVQVWINEFHYDGVTSFGQSDQGEFVEVVVRRTLYDNTTEFAKLKLVLYSSGALDQTGLLDGRGLPYNVASRLFTAAETEHPLTGFQACAVGSDYVVLSKALSNLQDLPAAFVVVYNNTTVVQLLSYEKVFKIAPATAGGGAAAGQTTTVIRTAVGDTARETALSQNNHSISLVGTGFSYDNFTWTDAITQSATPCAANAGQTFSTGAPLPVRWLEFRATGSGDKIFTQWTVADDAGTLQYEVELRGGTYDRFTRLATVQRQAANSRYDAVLNGVAPGAYTVRVKAVEASGQVVYSAERLVRLGKGTAGLTVYPNPVRTGTAALQFVAEAGRRYTVQIVNGTGSVVKQQVLVGVPAGSLATVNLDLNGLTPGTYSVRLIGGSEDLRTRIVVVK